MKLESLKQGFLLCTAMFIVGCACSLGGCSTLSWLTGPTGQVVLTGLADIAVGIAEQHGLSATEVKQLAGDLASVDYSTPTSLATAVPMVQAHGANIPLVDQRKLTILTSAIGQAVNATHPTDANSVQTSTGALLQSILTASSPNPKAPTAMSRPISHNLRHKELVSSEVNPSFCWDARSGYTKSCDADTPAYAKLVVSEAK